MFTVVIPVYNNAHIILRTLASVLTQTYKEFEVVIVNDGSTDNLLEVLNPLTSDSRIKIITQANQGETAARNTGVLNAKFEYIAFIDGDDEWLASYLEMMKKAIDQYPDACIYGCPSWHRDIMTGEAGNTNMNRYKNKIQKVEFFENPHAMPHISAIVVAKRFFNQLDNGNGFPVGMKISGDTSCIYRLAFLGDFVYIGYTLGIRNNNVPGQITAIKKDQQDKLWSFIVKYYNITHSFSTQQQDKKKANLFNIFLKYELRQTIVCSLRENDYNKIQFLLDGINSDCLSLLSNFEKKLYTDKKLKYFAIIYIYITKIIWRTHGFPVVGKAN